MEVSGIDNDRWMATDRLPALMDRELEVRIQTVRQYSIRCSGGSWLSPPMMLPLRLLPPGPCCSHQVVMAYTAALALALGAFRALPAAAPPALQWLSVAAIGFCIYGPQVGPCALSSIPGASFGCC